MTDSSAEDLQFNYIEHLQLEKLLTAQKFVSPHPEESVFVIMHQSYELWFRQVIHDLERIIAMLESDAVAQATWLIQRLGRIFQALDTQLGILEMMSAADFQEFRSYLKQSSGLQSRQFREIEVMGGLCETVGEAYETRVRAQWPGLVEEVPTTLHRAFVKLVERQPRSLVEIYEQRWKQFELFALSEACVELDRQILTWRSNHVRMVERMIGDDWRSGDRNGWHRGEPLFDLDDTLPFFPRALGRAQCFDRSKRRPDVELVTSARARRRPASSSPTSLSRKNPGNGSMTRWRLAVRCVSKHPGH